MNRIVVHGEDAKKKLKEGFDILAKAVGVTLGPNGRNVMFGRNGMPYITKDGVSVAKEIFTGDPVSSLGVELLKQVSLNTNKQAGDGTTTATVLAKSILDEGFKKVEEGVPPIEIKRQLDLDLKSILVELDEMAIKVENSDMLKNVIKVSTNNDDELTDLISGLYDQIGSCTITLENSATSTTYVEFLSGMSFNSSYIDRFFINTPDNKCILDRPAIMICEGKVDDKRSFINAIDQLASKTTRPLVLITEGVSQDIFLTLLSNQQSGKLKSVILNSPGFGPGREERLSDIAIYTGAEIIKKGMLKYFDLKSLGTAEEIIVTEENTTLKVGGGNQQEIDNRIRDLEASLKNKDDYTKASLEERISKFKGGVGVIRIGANSEVEFREKYDRVEDAKNAAKAALQEGVIPGGGTALYNIAKSYPTNSILGVALKSPYEKIKENIGLDEDFTSEDCIKNHVYDPVKVTKSALQNAISVAGTILTTECVIADE